MSVVGFSVFVFYCCQDKYGSADLYVFLKLIFSIDMSQGLMLQRYMKNLKYRHLWLIKNYNRKKTITVKAITILKRENGWTHITRLTHGRKMSTQTLQLITFKTSTFTGWHKSLISYLSSRGSWPMLKNDLWEPTKQRLVGQGHFILRW